VHHAHNPLSLAPPPTSTSDMAPPEGKVAIIVEIELKPDHEEESGTLRFEINHPLAEMGVSSRTRSGAVVPSCIRETLPLS
jgi:hypothetical protein